MPFGFNNIFIEHLKTRESQIEDSSLSETTSGSLLRIWIFIYLGLISYYLFNWPIVAYDTDLWYHLNGGRYFFEKGEIPRDAFFSFIRPSREWSNYYWLFQIIIYKCYSMLYYKGLIFIRTAIFLISLILILKYLIGDKYISKIYNIYLISVFLICTLVLIPRNLILRPHMFSYLMIILFLYLIEYKRKYIFLLPILTIVWINLHGIEYPVVILICMSYALEYFFIARYNILRYDRSYIIFITVAMWSLLLNPHRFRLLYTPLKIAPYQSQYISEIQPADMASGLIPFFRFYDSSMDFYSILFNIVVIAAISSVLFQVFTKSARTSHLLLFLGACLLISQSKRFAYEFTLLVLPLLRQNISACKNEKISDHKKIRSAAVIALMAISLVPIHNLTRHRPKYPMSSHNLPIGITTFLNHIQAKGFVLNHPNDGGYLQWALHENYKIFMDFEMIIFNDEDFFTISNAFSNKIILRKLISEYGLSFIVIPRDTVNARETMREFPEYVPVFFDDDAVLFMNKLDYPDIAEMYVLEKLDPFALSLSEENAENQELLSELKKMYDIYPNSRIVNGGIASILLINRNYTEAIEYIDRIINEYPEYTSGYILKGDILKQKKQYKEAITYYKKAMKNPHGGHNAPLYRNLWYCYSQLNQNEKAYDALKKAAAVFSSVSDYKDLFNLGVLAALTGKPEEALMWFKFAQLTVPPDNTELMDQIEDHMASLSRILNN